MTTPGIGDFTNFKVLTMSSHERGFGTRRQALRTLGGCSAWALGGGGLAVLSGCGGSNADTSSPPRAPVTPGSGVGVISGPSNPPAPTTPQPASPPRLTDFSTGLANPWGMAFLPDRRLLVTQKGGNLRLVGASGAIVSTPVAGVPTVSSQGQGGLLDVAVQPVGNDLWVYLSYAEPGTGVEAGFTGTAVARARLVGNSLVDAQVIFRAAPKLPTSVSTGHYGSRLALSLDGAFLFITLGDRQANSERGRAQDLTSHHGKVVRIRTDGSVPADNPFFNVAGARREIWSLGHRNVQGAAVRPNSGELWTSEHGPQGGDEVNLTLPGRNHGWPLISYGCEYGATPVGACAPVGGANSAPGLEQPVTFWVPTSIAPSGLCFYTGTLFPEWQGNLFMGALAGQSVWRLVLSGNALVSRDQPFGPLRDRIRDVRPGPDGALYLLTDNSNGRIIRVSPG